MRAWWLLLLVPLVHAQPTGLEVLVEAASFDYGPETWKNARLDEARDQQELTVRSADWSGSLGLHLDLKLTTRPYSSTAEGDWDYEVTLTDGATTLHGDAVPRGTGHIDVRFDVDGQRELPGMAAVQPLTPGTWTVHVTASQGNAPRGSGSVQVEGKGVTFLGFLQDDRLTDGTPVPEDFLPFVAEVGPGRAATMHTTPVVPGTSVTVQIDAGEAGRSVEWQAWKASSVTPDLGDPFGGTPFDVVGPIQPGGVVWGVQRERNQTVDPDGIAQFTFNVLPDSQGAIVMAAVDKQQGGVAVFLIGISDERLDVTGITGPDPGSEGSLVVEHTSTSDLVAGETLAWGISPSAANVLTRGDWFPQQESYRSDLDGRVLRAQADGSYRLGLLARDQSGYVTHAFEDRGVTAEIIAPTLGAGVDATVIVRLSHAGSVPVAGDVTFTFDGETTTDTFELLRGGRLDLQFPVTPGAPGSTGIEVIIDTGDLYRTERTTATVLDAEAFAKAEKAWYDPGKYVPGPLPILALLVAAFLRKR